jgi:hypothetical protein
LLKTGRPIEHTRRRWLHHLTGNLVAGLIAYNPAPKKPALNLEIIDGNKIEMIASVELMLF